MWMHHCCTSHTASFILPVEGWINGKFIFPLVAFRVIYVVKFSQSKVRKRSVGIQKRSVTEVDYLGFLQMKTVSSPTRFQLEQNGVQTWTVNCMLSRVKLLKNKMLFLQHLRSTASALQLLVYTTALCLHISHHTHVKYSVNIHKDSEVFIHLLLGK